LLTWMGHETGEAIDIDPSPSDGDRHFVLAIGSQSEGKVRIAAGPPFVYLPVGGDYRMSFSVTGTNIKPTEVSAVVSISKDFAMTLRPEPNGRTEGWAPPED